MNIILYKNASDNNTIGKSLSGAITLSGVLRDESSVSSPSFRIASNTNLSQYNYAYIESFGRYYFMTVTVERTGVWSLDLECDVLESFKNSILGLDAVIERQENDFNLYFSDPEWKVYETQQIVTRDFPQGFDSIGTFYLTASGGWQNIE